MTYFLGLLINRLKQLRKIYIVRYAKMLDTKMRILRVKDHQHMGYFHSGVARIFFRRGGDAGSGSNLINCHKVTKYHKWLLVPVVCFE